MRSAVLLMICVMSVSWFVAASASASQATLARGIQAFQNGDVQEATAAFERCVTDSDSRIQANYWLGLLHYAQGESAEAKRRLGLAYEAFSPAQEEPIVSNAARLTFPSTIEPRVTQMNGWQFHSNSTSPYQGYLQLQPGNHYSILLTPRQQPQKIRAIRWAGVALCLTWLLAR